MEQLGYFSFISDGSLRWNLPNCVCQTPASIPSEGLTLCVLRGAVGAVALHGHRVVVERRHARQAARQTGRHVTTLVVRANAVVAVNVGGVRHGFLQVSQTHTSTCSNHGGALFWSSGKAAGGGELWKSPSPPRGSIWPINSSERTASTSNFFCLLLYIINMFGKISSSWKLKLKLAPKVGDNSLICSVRSPCHHNWSE